MDKRLHVICKNWLGLCCISPESSDSKKGDEYHQLRDANTITHLNKAASRTFIPGREMSFEKGGVPSRFQYNPIRQYYKCKKILLFLTKQSYDQ